jgi:hypothetical protein
VSSTDTPSGCKPLGFVPDSLFFFLNEKFE